MNFFDSLLHYFFPRHSNNHKAKILHVSSLVLIMIFLGFFQVALNYLPRTGVKILGYAANISTDEVIRLTNEKRTQAGVSVLSYNALLTQAAFAKGNHMLANQYWAHIAPDGTEPWKFFTDAGYRYRYAGENLARDFSNPAAIVDAWMASPTHRENLLSTKYVDIGVAVVEGGLNGIDTTIIVQFFGSPLGESQPVLAQAKPLITISPTPSPETNAETNSVIVVTNTPTPTPTPLPETEFVGNSGQLDTLPPIESEASGLRVLLSPFQTTRGVSIAVTTLLIIVFAIDLIVVARKRIPRSSSRTFAHIAFLGMILVIIILARVGRIL
jgi:hypothetical protein